MVEDLVTSGISVFETIAPLEAEGLVVHDIVVLLDRQQGGRSSIEAQARAWRGWTAADAAQGKRLHAVLTITQLIAALEQHGRITSDVARATEAFIVANQVPATPPQAPVIHKVCVGAGSTLARCSLARSAHLMRCGRRRRAAHWHEHCLS